MQSYILPEAGREDREIEGEREKERGKERSFDVVEKIEVG